jgi:hypothetical protein
MGRDETREKRKRNDTRKVEVQNQTMWVASRSWGELTIIPMTQMSEKTDSLP